MIKWPFTKQRQRDEEVREQVSSAIHNKIAQINDLVGEIRGEKQEAGKLNGTKYSTG